MRSISRLSGYAKGVVGYLSAVNAAIKCLTFAAAILVSVTAGGKLGFSAEGEPFARYPVGQVRSMLVAYSRENDNYGPPRTSNRLADVANAKLVINRSRQVSALLQARERIQILSPYQGALDVPWGIQIYDDGAHVSEAIYLDGTLVHAYIGGGNRYVIDPSLKAWISAHYGCLRELALSDT